MLLSGLFCGNIVCDVDTNTAAKNSIRVLTREIGQWEPIKVVLPSKKIKKKKIKIEEKKFKKKSRRKK